VVVHGIVFDAADTHGVAFNVNVGDHIRLQHSELMNATHSGMQVAGDGYYELYHVNAHHNGTGPNTQCNDPPVNGGQCHGVYLNGVGVLIEGGEFHENEGWGVHIYSKPEQTTVRNAKAWGQDVGIGIIGGAGPHEVSGNEVYDNELGMWFASPPVAAHDNSIHDNGLGMAVNDGGNTITNNAFDDNGEHLQEPGGNVIENNTMN
jgi:hypothetical protein